MANIYLDSTKTKHVLSDQEALIKELNSLLKQVDSVRSGLRHKIACRATIDARLLDTKNQINLEMQRTTIMRDAFTQIIALYQQTETKNLELLKTDETTAQNEKFHISGARQGGPSGGISIAGLPFGGTITASGDVLSAWYEVTPNKIEGEAHVAQGELEYDFGLISGKTSAAVGKVTGSAGFGASLYDEGHFRPNLFFEASTEASLLEGEFENQLGSDSLNFHTGAKGKVLTANAGAGAYVGVIKTKDKNGNEVSVVGAQAKVGAEAYVASGEVEGGITVFGIRIDASLEGHVGAGAHAEAGVTSSGINVDLDAALGLGLGLNLDIDWSDFKFSW